MLYPGEMSRTVHRCYSKIGLSFLSPVVNANAQRVREGRQQMLFIHQLIVYKGQRDIMAVERAP